MYLKPVFITQNVFKMPYNSKIESNVLIYTSYDELESQMLMIYKVLCTGTQLLIVIIDATWNVNACHYEVSYASASSLRMRRSTSSVLGR